MANPEQQTASGPVSERARITSLDLIRGIAVLGILLMNAVHFKYGTAPYFNLSVGGSETWLDWAVGIFGEIFIDQKFMGLFSLLFGAGMILFIDRASARGGRAVALNMWRNVLLLGIGILHFTVWDGDVLMAYAISSFFLAALRRLPNKALIALGALIFLLSVSGAMLSQYIANSSGASLSGIWEPGEIDNEDFVGIPALFGFFLRALGLILLGAGLYRTGFMNGGMSDKTYRVTAIAGLAMGLSLATLGVIVTAMYDYSREVAFIGQMPNTLGTIPGDAGIHGAHHPLEQPRRRLVKTTPARDGQNGAHQLPHANHPRRPGPHHPARRCRMGEPRGYPAVRLRGVGVAALVVAGMAQPLPIRPRRMALARRHLPPRPAPPPPLILYLSAVIPTLIPPSFPLSLPSFLRKQESRTVVNLREPNYQRMHRMPPS